MVMLGLSRCCGPDSDTSVECWSVFFVFIHNLRVVLKPPGGGSSISFGEDEDNRPKNLAQQQAPQEKSPKAETNGTATPESVNDAAATKENNPSAATNGSVTNGSPVGSNSGRSSECATTPTSAKKLDTQNRLFGEDPVMDTPTRKVRDHQRSTIFSDGPGTKPNGSTNGPRAVFCRTWTRRDPVTGVGVLCWDIHAPRCAPNKRKAVTPAVRESVETKTQEQPQPQQKQRQRVPPGGFSTQLW
ncbi:uncharacterized protein [Procambarus clarkii]|uniref:uncharacterized protein isoform X2 n=1 Tax=Procambarus clarkii TaxID=6728 RepID=UPI001E66FEFD|nr:uncharacterized protein LOC123755765 isoform X3 [Procambarus clarkii]